MQQLLRMGRGAVIRFRRQASDEIWILANNHPVARGEIQISDEQISIAVTRAANVCRLHGPAGPDRLQPGAPSSQHRLNHG